jgi:hypothetical protein
MLASHATHTCAMPVLHTPNMHAGQIYIAKSSMKSKIHREVRRTLEVEHSVSGCSVAGHGCGHDLRHMLVGVRREATAAGRAARVAIVCRLREGVPMAARWRCVALGCCREVGGLDVVAPSLCLPAPCGRVRVAMQGLQGPEAPEGGQRVHREQVVVLLAMTDTSTQHESTHASPMAAVRFHSSAERLA